MIQQILENSGNPKEMFEIGKEALSTIPKSYTDRATVALFCAQNALKLTNQKEAEICWLEAFESDTTLMNYWRLRLLSKNWNEYKETVQLFYEKLYEQPKDYSSFSMFEPRLNKLHYSDYEILRWCDGIPLDETKENTNFLIPLLLLYLNPLDNNSKGIQKIKDLACDCLHVDTSFNDGTLLQKNKTQIIDDIIECRKNSIPFNDIQLVEELIDQEVRSILKHTNRKQYWKCALFIAVLGEVKGCKEEIMDCYLNEYPLHRAFHREMQTYR